MNTNKNKPGDNVLLDQEIREYDPGIQSGNKGRELPIDPEYPGDPKETENLQPEEKNQLRPEQFDEPRYQVKKPK